jgi:hypothetical protein
MFRLVLLLVVVVVDEEGVWKVVMPPRPQWFCVRSRNGDDKNDGDVKADPRAASEAIKTTRQSMEILIGGMRFVGKGVSSLVIKCVTPRFGYCGKETLFLLIVSHTLRRFIFYSSCDTPQSRSLHVYHSPP